ncbi:MAG: hypothetical protein AABZ57_04215 [Candidatus Margulisiibacteriota bacterium]|mgnify:CR=1 FL=1
MTERKTPTLPELRDRTLKGNSLSRENPIVGQDLFGMVFNDQLPNKGIIIRPRKDYGYTGVSISLYNDMKEAIFCKYGKEDRLIISVNPDALQKFIFIYKRPSQAKHPHSIPGNFDILGDHYFEDKSRLLSWKNSDTEERMIFSMDDYDYLGKKVVPQWFPLDACTLAIKAASDILRSAGTNEQNVLTISYQMITELEEAARQIS